MNATQTAFRLASGNKIVLVRNNTTDGDYAYMVHFTSGIPHPLKVRDAVRIVLCDEEFKKSLESDVS